LQRGFQPILSRSTLPGRYDSISEAFGPNRSL
jgi:hypothetical protein